LSDTWSYDAIATQRRETGGLDSQILPGQFMREHFNLGRSVLAQICR